MGDFNSAYAFAKKWEGGYAKVPSDRGGETNYGISASTLVDARNAGIIDSSVQSVKDLTPEDAKTIYRKMFWDKIHGDELPSDLSIALFDTAVNSGVERSIGLLQIILNVTHDGIIGPETLQAINNYNGNLVEDYLAAREQNYETIVRKYPDQNKNSLMAGVIESTI